MRRLPARNYEFRGRLSTEAFGTPASGMAGPVAAKDRGQPLPIQTLSWGVALVASPFTRPEKGIMDVTPNLGPSPQDQHSWSCARVRIRHQPPVGASRQYFFVEDSEAF